MQESHEITKDEFWSSLRKYGETIRATYNCIGAD